MKASRAIRGTSRAMRPKMMAKSPLSAMIHQLCCTIWAAVFCMIENLLLSYMNLETTIAVWFSHKYTRKEKLGNKHCQTEEMRLFAPNTSQVQSQAHVTECINPDPRHKTRKNPRKLPRKLPYSRNPLAQEKPNP